MTTQNRLRAAVATTVTATALAFVAGIAASSPAMAENVCYAAGVTGSITGTHNVPERCVGTRPQTYAWVPFGGGVKRCLGAAFSMRELITVLHVLLREGEFTAVDSMPEKIVRRSIMLAPRHGTRVRFRPHSAG